MINKWTRKENCPYCDVACGSLHNKACPIKNKDISDYRKQKANEQMRWFMKLSEEEKKAYRKRCEDSRKPKIRLCQCGKRLEKAQHRCSECKESRKIQKTKEYNQKYYNKVVKLKIKEKND